MTTQDLRIKARRCLARLTDEWEGESRHDPLIHDLFAVLEAVAKEPDPSSANPFPDGYPSGTRITTADGTEATP